MKYSLIFVIVAMMAFSTMSTNVDAVPRRFQTTLLLPTNDAEQQFLKQYHVEQQMLNYFEQIIDKTIAELNRKEEMERVTNFQIFFIVSFTFAFIFAIFFIVKFFTVLNRKTNLPNEISYTDDFENDNFNKV